MYYALGTGEYNELTREHPLLFRGLTPAVFTLVHSGYLGTHAEALRGHGTHKTLSHCNCALISWRKGGEAAGPALS